jgi:hypothetical protein
MRHLARSAPIVAALATMGCLRQVHPEYHPETSYRYTQNVSYPTQTVVMPVPLRCPTGSSDEGGVCVAHDAACPTGSHAAGTTCVIDDVRCPAGARPDGSGACVVNVDVSCSRGLHFVTDRGCVANVSSPESQASPEGVASDKSSGWPGWGFTCSKLEPSESGGCTGGVVGLRGDAVSVSTAAVARSWGVSVASDVEWFVRKGVFSALFRYNAAIGAGDAGFDGALSLGLWLGARAPVSENQGPILRAGGLGYLQGNNTYETSLLEPSQLQLGWQWSRGATVLEAAATGGFALAGSFSAQSAESRTLGAGVAYGGYAALQTAEARLSILAERLPSDDGLGPVDRAGVLACVRLPLAVCADAHLLQAQARTDGSELWARVWYGGMTVGMGL